MPAQTWVRPPPHKDVISPQFSGDFFSHHFPSTLTLSAPLPNSFSWAPTGMGKRGHSPPLEMLTVKCSCALVVTAKRSKDELFTHYFHNLSSASGDFAPMPPPGLNPRTPLGDFRLQKANLPTPGKNHAGARGLFLGVILSFHVLAERALTQLCQTSVHTVCQKIRPLNIK